MAQESFFRFISPKAKEVQKDKCLPEIGLERTIRLKVSYSHLDHKSKEEFYRQKIQYSIDRDSINIRV